MSWGIDLEQPDGEIIEIVHGHTYNLSPMWRLAGVFEGSSSELDGMLARELAILSRWGIVKAERDPASFEKLEPANGWGDFDGFVQILNLVAELCTQHPNAIVRWEG